MRQVHLMIALSGMQNLNIKVKPTDNWLPILNVNPVCGSRKGMPDGTTNGPPNDRPQLNRLIEFQSPADFCRIALPFGLGGRVAMQRTATPCTPVRFRSQPPQSPIKITVVSLIKLRFREYRRALAG